MTTSPPFLIPEPMPDLVTQRDPWPPGSRPAPSAASEPIRRSGQLVALTGARGGAGASVLAAALARTAARAGLRCLLVDGDHLGAGLDLLLGAEETAGMRWPDLALARGDLVPGTLGQGLPVIDGIRILTWDRTPGPPVPSPEAVEAVLRAGRAEHDLVILDLPRCGGLVRCPPGLIDLGLIVVPAEVRAAACAAKVVAEVFAGARDVQVVVRGPAPTGLAAPAIGSVLGLPVAAQARAEPGLAAALDRGEPPGLRQRGPLARACRAILAGLALPVAAERRPARGQGR